MRKFALLILVLLLLGCTQLTAEEIAKEMQKRYEAHQTPAQLFFNRPR
ncbi:MULTISPECIES: hypothetical protein [unclassified Archaeoglobus]|nr:MULTISPECIES: hypothetical protein [unclassified Archaeoglobus]